MANCGKNRADFIAYAIVVIRLKPIIIFIVFGAYKEITVRDFVHNIGLQVLTQCVEMYGSLASVQEGKMHARTREAEIASARDGVELEHEASLR